MNVDWRRWVRQCSANRCRLESLTWISILLLAAFAVVPAWAVAQFDPSQVDPLQEKWRWRAFSELKGRGLRCMVEDTDESMWFGVDSGVIRYDGVHWVEFGASDDLVAPVNCLLTTRSGNIYAGSELGLSQYASGTWQHVFPAQKGIAWPVDAIIESHDGAVWSATAWGAVRIGEDGVRVYTSADRHQALTKLIPELDVRIVPERATPAVTWNHSRLGTGIGLRMVEGAVTGMQRGTGPMLVWAVAPGGPADLAGIGAGDEVLTIDGVRPVIFNDALLGEPGSPVELELQRSGDAEVTRLSVRRSSLAGAVSDFSVADICEDDTNRLWVALESGEVVRWSGAEDWRLYGADDGLVKGRSPRILQTQDGTMWSISLQSTSGVNRLDGDRWTHLSFSSLGGSNMNTSILQTADGKLWVGGSSLHVHDRGRWHIYDAPEVLVPTHRTRFTESSDGALWVAGLGQEAGRLDYRSTTWRTYEGLHFGCEALDGSKWFLTNSERVALMRDGNWRTYGVEDGLMDDPNVLVASRGGAIWAGGSHDHKAAIASWNGEHWVREVFPQFSSSVNRIFESADGALWIGGAGKRASDQTGGVLRVEVNEAGGITGQTTYLRPQVPNYLYGIGQTGDGQLWFGGSYLVRFDGQQWHNIEDPPQLATFWSDVVYSVPNGSLYIGTRTYGVFSYTAPDWNRFDVSDGLADNRVIGALQTRDGSLWVTTTGGVSRFDGETWLTHALPTELGKSVTRNGMAQTGDGALWINRLTPGTRSEAGQWLCTRYVPDSTPPVTEITFSAATVSYPGNTTITWKASDPWFESSEVDLQYTWRIDEADWSPYSASKNITLTSIPSGSHTFRVKARDRDFNEDPTPAAVHFTVLPPVWGQFWFQGLMFVLLSAIAVQTIRVVRRGRRLRVANTALSESNKSLFSLNRDLQERSTELQLANTRLEDLDRLKTDFFSMVSHDLRTPMTAVKGYVDNMLDGVVGELNSRQTRYLERIRISSDRLIRMISDLLDLSRLERGAIESLDLKPTAIDMLGTVREAVDGLRPIAESNSVALRLEGVSIDVLADRDRVQQVVTNLVGNAMKFTEAGGEIHVSVAPGPNGFALITVRDTGIGIVPSDLAKIFDLFFRVQGQVTREPGSGLGLAISQRLVELMGGEITAQSEVGVGSTFTFTLPRAVEDQA